MKEKLAIIVGRFQTFRLSPEQITMIKNVIESYPKTVIVLANSIMRGTIANPLDMKARKTMLKEAFPNIEIGYVNDNPFDDRAWSTALEFTISSYLHFGIQPSEVVILGGKDTVCKKYVGIYKTREFDASSFISNSEIIRQAIEQFPPTLEWRAGYIASMANRYPTAYQTVDAIVINDKKEILLARKPGKTQYCIIGGFSDPTSLSLEDDAIREVKEEASVIVDNPVYLGSMLVVKEKRYAFEVDKVKTALFSCKYISGRPEGKDDVAEVRWFPIDEIKKNSEKIVVDYHLPLINLFLNKLEN